MAMATYEYPVALGLAYIMLVGCLELQSPMYLLSLIWF